MIQTYTVSTSEIDDPQIAAAEIQSQLTALRLLSHSVGIMVCQHDFVAEGAAAAIARVLPFPLIGLTTFYQTTPAINGLFELTVTVLTSDTVRFSVKGTGTASGDEDPAQFVKDTYDSAYGLYGEAPAMILSFLSVRRPVSGDAFLRMLDAASGGVPCFGGVTTGNDDEGIEVYVLCEDQVFNNGFALLLIIGDVRPAFYSGNFIDKKLLEMTATVTRAEGTVVKELNGQSAVSFLKKNGLELGEDDRDIISIVPFLYKLPNEEKMTARTLGGFDEDGGLKFLAEIPERAILRMGTVSMGDILRVSHNTIERVVRENENAGALLIFSCVGRYITLGISSTSEMEYVAEVIPETMPYLACYVGGEMCPVEVAEGYVNRYHNSSFIVCALN